MPVNRDQKLNLLRSVDWVVNPSGEVAIASGDTLELRVTLMNQGHQGAVFDVYLDETAEPVRHWCRESFQRLALDAQQSAEVVFQLEVPLQTLPDAYEYLLVLDAPQHYPEETPLQHQSRLRVLPPVQSAEQTKDPTFRVVPETTPTQPLLLRPGQPLEFQAVVHNRSDRVDRFRLTCADLPESWYRIVYPEGLQNLGQVISRDSLLLNPGAEGRILLLLQLPGDVPAGQHLPTLRLHTANHPDLVLIDVAYLQVAPHFALDLHLRSQLSRVQTGAGTYELILVNGSNTQRSLTLTAQETAENPVCTYELATADLTLAPGATTTVPLAVQPTRRWRRPWWGRGWAIPFYVEAQDTLALRADRDRVEGELLWEARPWWQRLLAVALIIGGLTALGLLIWLAFFRPPARLQVAELAAEGELYEAAQNDFIHLRWQVGPPSAIRSLQLTGQALSGDRDPAPLTYDLSDGLPPELQDICTITRRWLTCRFVRTDARQPGDYRFELTALPRQTSQAIATAESESITINPLPDPQIARLTSQLMAWKPRPDIATANRSPRSASLANPLAAFPWLFQGAIAPINLAQLPDQILVLAWQIAHPGQLTQLELTGRAADSSRDLPTLTWPLAAGLPEELQPFCQVSDQQLSCQRFPAAVQAGEYVFELAARYGITADDPVGTVLTAATDPLQLVAPPAPEILAFAPDRFTYDAGTTGPLRLGWTISHPGQLQTVRIIGRSTDGRVSVPPFQFTFSGGMPPALANFCQLSATQLTCSGVPIEFDQPGQYQFELEAVAIGTGGQAATKLKSEQIDIEGSTANSPGPRVQFFRIDGQNAPPKYTVALDPNAPARDIRLAWKVTGTDLQVELLPSPGTVPADAFLTYELGPGEKTETLTLRVTDGEGRQVQRSVVIATTVATPSAAAGSPSAPAAMPSSSPAPVNLPSSDRDRLRYPEPSNPSPTQP